MSRRRHGVELLLVIVVAFAALAPGIQSYTLVDPWETHYGEVGRNMLVDNDFVLTQWPGTNLDDQPNEGFRSKPVLTFWLMAASMKLFGLGDHGGYSGEMVESARTMVAIRLPFIATAVGGLVLMWLMLARLVSRRLAWLALLVVGSTPFFCLVARQAIPDMPLTACVIGAISLFLLAVEDGDRPLTTWQPRLGRWRPTIDARHVLYGAVGGFVLLQLVYNVVYFLRSPDWALRGAVPNPAIWLPVVVGLCLFAQWGWGLFFLRMPFILLGLLGRLIRKPRIAVDPSWRFPRLQHWERTSVDRVAFTRLVALFSRRADDYADRFFSPAPITTMRPIYMLGCYALLGVSILAKGPPGLAVVGGVGVFHVLLLSRWSALASGAFELGRGVFLMVAVFLPWHLAIWAKAGFAWLNEYVFTHVFNRATAGVDNSPGTFAHIGGDSGYSGQIGHGMWLWAALIPVAVFVGFYRARPATVEGRVRLTVGIWAVTAVALFCLVQTKFHHYILPAVPALGILVAFFLDDILARRERLHPLFAALAIAITLFIARDLMFEPERWIEMFVFRYDRAWPSLDPWAIDTSDGFLALGIAGAIAIAIMATRYARLGVGLVCGVGLAICLWSLHAYMPLAGRHWGMREAVRTYYEQRSIYGQTLVYFDRYSLVEDWGKPRETWSFDTMIPSNLQVGQPMRLTVQLRKPEDDRVVDATVELAGRVTKLGPHTVTMTLGPAERAKLAPYLKATGAASRHRPLYAVDADRLIAWQLYWRGEQFWSAGEIWDYLPEMRTSFPPTNNKEFQKYVADTSRMPPGKRYFVVTDAGRVNTIKGLLPKGIRNFRVLDTTSNKFSLAAFDY